MTARIGSTLLLLLALLALPFATTGVAQEDDEQLMTESELALKLVQVLGLSPMLPVNPSPAEAYQILLLNGVSPKDGWNSTNLVNFGNLARILVQSMGAEDDIEDTTSDKAYVDYLKSIGVEFGTIQDAIDQTSPIAQPLANEAIKVSTDPLKKDAFIRPIDEQQSGADLQVFRKVIPAVEIEQLFLAVPVVEPKRPDALTPN